MLRNLFSINRSIPSHSDDKIIIYSSELEYLSKCITESPNIETGGNLFGLWTPFSIPVIQYVVGPGPAAYHHTTQFRQDIRFLEMNADKIVEEHALHHIGTWHSHHSLGLTEPSDGDTNSTLTGMRECGLSSFVLLIGNYREGKSSVNAFRYFSNGTCIKLRWVVLQGDSPFRQVYDKTHPTLIYHPQGHVNRMPLEECSLIENESPKSPAFDESYWLSKPENRKEFAAIITFLKTHCKNVSIYQNNGSCVELRLTNSSTMYKFLFDDTFPQEAPKFLAPKNRKLQYKTSPEWDVNGGNISEAFIHFFKSIEI